MIRDLAVATRRRTAAGPSLPLLLIGALVAGLVVLAAPAPPALAQTAPATGVYVPLSPARIFNTQSGGGGVVAAQSSRDVQVAGLGGIPTTDVLAVVLDLTVYNNNSGAWGILWQAGTTRPYPASSINYVPGRVVTNSVTTKVGASGSAAGKVSFFTWEATDMLIDVVGYYRTAPGGGGYVPLTQTRILDTAGAKIPANSSIDRKLRGVAGIPDSTAVTAVVMNATVYGATGPGPLTVWPRGVARPDTSVMNYSPATARTEMVTATLSADGWASVWTWASIDLIIDVAGYYTTGSNSTFVPLTPKRIVDTRYNGTRYNNNPNWGIGPVTQYLTPNTATAIKVTGTGGVPETGVSTVILNVVADAATTATSSQLGFLTVWASGDAQPGILTMSYYGAESASNLVMAKVGADGKINIYNYYAATELIIDVVGYFTTGTGPGAPTNVIAAPANQGATLAWGPPASDGGTALAGYLVKVYKTTPTLTYVSETTTCATCTSTTLTGLTNGQPYQFEVSARNSLGYGSPATSNVVTPNMTTTTSTSTTTTVPPTTTSTSTTTTVPPTTTTTTPGPTTTTPGPTTTTVAPTTTTTVAPTTTTTTPPARAPDRPSGVTASEGSGEGEVSVSWDAPNNNGSLITGYTVRVTPGCPACPEVTVGGGTLSTTIGNLAFGQPYSFEVVATNAIDTGEPSAPTSPPVRPYARTRVLTWNVRDTEFAEPALFASLILFHEPEIVGLQEATASQAGAIAAEMTARSGSTWHVFSFMSNAILTKWDIVAEQGWAFQAEPTRSVIRAKILDPYANEVLYVYVTHLSATNTANRESQAAVVRELILSEQANEAGAGNRFRSILTGDLNEPGAPRYQEGGDIERPDGTTSISQLDPNPMRDVWLALGFADAFDRNADITADTTINDDAVTAPNPGPDRLPARIDYIMFGATASGISAYDAFVDKTATELRQDGTFLLSDHRPVIADLTVRP